MDDYVSSLLEELQAAAAELDVTIEEALAEKAEELRQRAFFRLIPDSRLTDKQVPGFLELVTGHPPSEELIESVTVVRRGVRLSREEVMDLEFKQNYRCAICGTTLSKAVGPAVDHIQPLAMGGKNELANYQLLCRLCNSGKGKLPAWMVGVPFLTNRISARLRYCVLVRYDSSCQVDGCSSTSRTSPLEVRLRIPASQGGRVVFDNLLALCEKHARKRDASARRRSLDSLRLRRRKRLRRLA
jgi:5-methylcytosine-specific restriction endonuclease McrA